MPADQFVLLGVNHKTTPVEVREKMALSGGYEEPLAALRRISGVQECFLLSTCNRVEILLVVTSECNVDEEIVTFLFGKKISREKSTTYLYIHRGLDAIRHLFMVAASLDSMVVGEAQILGQLKDAYRQAGKEGCTGPLLNKLLHKSFSAAKRVRTETGIGSSAVSISYAAVQLARKIFGNLQDKGVMLIGAGEMAELAAEHLLGQGVCKVVVANRTLSRAVKLAQRFNGKAVVMEELISQLGEVDIIISSTGATDIILSREDVRPVMRSRRNRPLFFIDIAVPRDLDPALIELGNVYLYDIDDLSNVVEINRAERDREAVKAERIVDEETIKFQGWLERQAVIPTIQALRQKVEEIGVAELDRTLARLEHLSDEDKRRLEKMVAAISAKVLHAPMVYLKENSCSGRDNRTEKVSLIHEIFGLSNGDYKNGSRRTS